MPRLARLSWLRLLMIVKVAMLARRHLTQLSPDERRRLMELARRGRHLDRDERAELRKLASRLEPQAFARAAAETLRGRR